MHIVIVNRWPRFDGDPERWDNELTRYEEFVDHDAHQVSYVVDALGAEGILADPGKIAALVKIDDVNDFDSLRQAVAEIGRQVGPVDRLIALSEFTLEIAARVREELDIPGPRTEEVAVYRDKVRMKEILAAAGVRVPRFAALESPEQGAQFARSTGFPVIVKPVDGAASIGVHKVDDAQTLAALLPTLEMSRHEIEEFVTGVIHHVDGYADDNSQVTFQVVSRYVNDCLGFGAGEALGSVVVNDSELRTRIEEFTRETVRILGLATTPFHLELFVTPTGELVFLEVGGRVGGSEVPHLLNKVFGVNLFEVWLRSLSGEQVAAPVKSGDPSGGWLVVPKPAKLPVRVTKATPMAGSVATVWRELLPVVGELLEGGHGYDALHSGRFILLDDSETRVEADIRHIIENFEFEASAI